MTPIATPSRSSGVATIVPTVEARVRIMLYREGVAHGLHVELVLRLPIDNGSAC